MLQLPYKSKQDDYYDARRIFPSISYQRVVTNAKHTNLKRNVIVSQYVTMRKIQTSKLIFDSKVIIIIQNSCGFCRCISYNFP